MRRIAALAVTLFTAVILGGALAGPASAMVTPPQPDPIVIVDR